MNRVDKFSNNGGVNNKCSNNNNSQLYSVSYDKQTEQP